MYPLFATIHIGKHEGKIRRKDFTNMTSPPDRPNVPTKAQRKRERRERAQEAISMTAAPTTCSQHNKKSAEEHWTKKAQESSGGKM